MAKVHPTVFFQLFKGFVHKQLGIPTYLIGSIGQT